MYIIKLWQKSNIIKKTLCKIRFTSTFTRADGRKASRRPNAATPLPHVTRSNFRFLQEASFPKTFFVKVSNFVDFIFLFFSLHFSRIGLGFQIHHGLSELFSHFPWKKSGRILWQCLGNCAAFKKDDNGLYDHYFFYSDPNLNSPKNSQCGNCKNFMSFIFYVKST